MATYESEYYDIIGEWLIQQKGCQKNKYSKGYAKEVGLSESSRVDVFGLKYTFYDGNSSYNSFKFHGYAVEVKHTPSDAANDIDKIVRIYLPEMRRATPKRMINGLHTINYYVAFKGDSTSQDLLTQCRNAGVGILRLHENDVGQIDIEEELAPEEHSLPAISNRDQQSPGIFEQALRETTYVNRVIEDPDKLFEECLRPKLVEVARQRALEHALGYCSAKAGREALDYLFEQVIMNNPKVTAKGRGNRDHEDIVAIISRSSGEQVLQLEMKLNYFYIDTMDGKRYRVVSKNEVLGSSGESGVSYTIDLPKLIETEIEPRLKA
jgi:hypothetical protein